MVSLVFHAIAVIFVEGFSLGHTSLIFISIGIGTTMGPVVNIPTSRRYPKLLMKWRGFSPPENRRVSALSLCYSLYVRVSFSELHVLTRFYSDFLHRGCLFYV